MAAVNGYSQCECVNFLNKRIELDCYRGLQISQHNRFDFEVMCSVLEEINKMLGGERELLQIRTTDLSKRPFNIEGEEKYATLVINISNKIGRCTQDSLRKNLFVDMHRMGLIDRYDADKILILPYKRSKVKYISLTPLALRLIRSDDIFEKRMIYTRAIESMMQGYGETISSIMVELEMKSISYIEMSLFTSFVGESVDEIRLTSDDIKRLLREYNNLSVYQRKDIVNQLQQYCNSTMCERNKKNKRDWHNWMNESQQIINLLGQTVFFEHKGGILYLRTSSDGVFAGGRLERSKIEREKYYKEHDVCKRLGFELHHIVPLCWAKSKEEFRVLDCWKNLVYIDAYSHAKITQQDNKNVVLDFHGTKALFSNFGGNVIECEKGENIEYKISLQNTMKEYNNSILKDIK